MHGTSIIVITKWTKPLKYFEIKNFKPFYTGGNNMHSWRVSLWISIYIYISKRNNLLVLYMILVFLFVFIFAFLTIYLCWSRISLELVVLKHQSQSLKWLLILPIVLQDGMIGSFLSIMTPSFFMVYYLKLYNSCSSLH